MSSQLSLCSFLFAGLALPAGASDLVSAEDLRLVPSGLLGGDGAGYSVSLDGDTLAVGAHLHPAAGEGAGAVFVYRQVGGAWSEEATLIGSHTNQGDAFGSALDLQGERLVVGAAWRSGGGQPRVGEAYVFERVAGTWQQSARLLATGGDGEDLFGIDVALDGDRIVLGAQGTQSWRGSVYVFELQGGNWVQTHELAPSQGGTNQLFGSAVDVDGDLVAVGATWMDLSDPSSTDRPGAAYVFRRDGNTWSEDAALAGVGLNGFSSQPSWLGQAIAIQGTTLVAGSPRNLGSSGSAFVFEHTGGAWTQTAQLVSSFVGQGWFGHGLDLDGDRIACGAPLAEPLVPDQRHGAVSVWQRQSSGWSERRLLLADGMLTPGQLGYGVALQGDRVLAGAAFENAAGLSSGAAYLFSVPRSDGETFCFGDGLGTPCPCNWDNHTPGNGGCLNGDAKAGLLVGVGSSSVAADDFALVARGLLPGQAALLFRGTSELAGGDGVVFGNGLRCVGGSVSRVGTQHPLGAGSVSWGPGLAVSEGFAPGDLGLFQVWYRDPAHFCAGGFNFTNAYRLSFEL